MGLVEGLYPFFKGNCKQKMQTRVHQVWWSTLNMTVEEWRLSSRFIVGEAHNDYLQIALEIGFLGLSGCHIETFRLRNPGFQTTR